MVGVLAGIARHARPKGAMEVLDAVGVTTACGIEGDWRGAVPPGGKGRRQVTLMAAADWRAAIGEIGRDIAWQERRVNLLAEDIALPRTPGTRIAIGEILLEMTRECDPCVRMEAIAPGLCAALAIDWRGGVCCRVLQGGRIAVGDRIEVRQ